MTSETGASDGAIESLSETTERRIAVNINQLSKSYPIPLARLKQFFRRATKPPVEPNAKAA